MLFSEQFSQGLIFSATNFYRKGIGLKVIIFILKVWWQ